MGHVTHMWNVANAYRMFIGKLEGTNPHRRRSCRWEDNNKICIKETECENVDWIHLIQDVTSG